MVAEKVTGKTVVVFKLDQIEANPWQPRREIGDVSTLAASIEKDGLLQLPLSRPLPGQEWLGEITGSVPVHASPEWRTQLAFGHRRHASFEVLGRDVMSVEVDPLTDEQMARYALAENRERVQLQELEELEAARRALDEVKGLRHQDVAEWLGCSRTNLTNRLRVLQLPDRVLGKVRSGAWSVRAGLELLPLRCKLDESGWCGGLDRQGWLEKVLHYVSSQTPTVEAVRSAVIKSRPKDWVQLDKKDDAATHKLKSGRYGDNRDYWWICDKDAIKEVKERQRVEREEALDGWLSALVPAVQSQPGIAAMAGLLKPDHYADWNRIQHDIRGDDAEETDYKDWDDSYREWADSASAQEVLGLIRWQLERAMSKASR